MKELKSIRQYLHQYPELSGEEISTSKYVRNVLSDLGVKEFIGDFSSPSFIACIPGQKQKGNILFRCELDALPIAEDNAFSYRSNVSGVSHKCGHDGHMTILIGLAVELIKQKSEFGNVYLFFQSAEEIGKGAQELINLDYLKKLEIDYAFALHNVPGFKKGSIICKSGVFTPHVESISIKLKGEVSHAGQPDKGLNPSRLLTEINSLFYSLHQPKQTENDYCVVAPIFIEMGERAYGTSAGSAEMGFTLRTISSEDFERKREYIEKALQDLQLNSDILLSWEWLEPFYSTNNDFDAFRFIQSAADKLKFEFNHKENPFDWGEDFGLITQEVKGAMFGLGAGLKSPDLHDSSYDFPDEIISNGVAIFQKINQLIQHDLQQ